MASVWVDTAGKAAPATGRRLIACVTAHGSATHPYAGSESLVSGAEASRNLADAIHFLCALHGRHPSIVDHAALRSIEPEARAWLGTAAEAVAIERGFLARLAVAAGPVPGTPGGAAAEAAVGGQRSALATLASSDRRGCALGAALAFALDWAAVRAVLDAAARRLGVEAPSRALGEEAEIRALADIFGSQAAAVERALLFGAEQLALQHRGLWDLLEARQLARSALAA